MNSQIDRLDQMFRAAENFGLTDEEVWQIVNEVCEQVSATAPVEASIDDVATALARRIQLNRAGR